MYPLWHWELLWQLAHSRLASPCHCKSLFDTLGFQSPLKGPYMQTHFSFDSSPWVWAALSPVHPSLCWRNKHHMHWVNLSSPSCFLNVPCTYFSYKLCLNPLVGHAEWPFSVLRPETQIPVGTIMVPFLLVICFSFFFSPSNSASWAHIPLPAPPPPPSYCLLLFAHLSPKHCKQWGFVWSCCGQSAG